MSVCVHSMHDELMLEALLVHAQVPGNLSVPCLSVHAGKAAAGTKRARMSECACRQSSCRHQESARV